MKTKRNSIVSLFFLLAMALPASADRGLTIDAVNLNGSTGNEIRMRPGARVAGTIVVSTSSSSLLREHTGVWLPSWQKNSQSMRVFLSNFLGGVGGTPVAIDISAPETPGIYYLLFSFDRKRRSEMFQEILLKTDEQRFAEGKAVRIIVDNGSATTVLPIGNSRENAVALELGGGWKDGSAGHDSGVESWWRIVTAPTRPDEAIKVRLVGTQPSIDLEMEILDERMRRRGYSEGEGSAGESSAVRVLAGDVLFVRVFAFKPGQGTPFRIHAERIQAVRSDPSKGKALAIGDGYSAMGRTGKGDASAWYSVTLDRPGRIEIDVIGMQPARDFDLWIYDDLGNARAISRNDGSGLETGIVDAPDAGTFTIRVGAVRSTDTSDFQIRARVTGGAPVPIPGTIWSTELDTGTRMPAQFEIARDRDFDGYFRVGSEPSFTVEFFTGWGEIGRLDSILITAPDGSRLWEKSPEGKGWESAKIHSRGPGNYRVQVRYTGEGIRRGRIEILGLSDPHLYRAKPSDLGAGGPGIDAAEKNILRKLYDMMIQRESGISAQESEMLQRLEEYFNAR